MKVFNPAWNRTSLLTAICASLIFCPDSYAQSGSDASEDAESLVLEEVIVTAQRRETNLQTTALAASVLSGEQLREKGIDSLERIQYSTPSMTLSTFGSANVINIRGIGRSKVDIEIPSGVIIYQDGVPTITGYFQNEPYYDINSIEVLRGPQGTFVGKSASGGAIFINTRSPEMNVTDGNLELGVGSNNFFEGRGYMNASSSDTFAFRAAFNYQNRDHYYDEITGPFTGDPGSQDLKSLRLGLLWQPTEKLSINFKGNWADLDFGGNVTSSFGDPLFTVHQDAPFAYVDESTRMVLDVDYVFDSGIKLSSLTGYQTVDSINNLDFSASDPLPRYWFRSNIALDFWSQEFNLISDEDQRLRWVLGLFVQHQKGELLPISEDGFTFYGGDVFGFQLPLDFPWFASPWIKDEDDWAVFGHIVYDLTQNLELEVGARYSDYEFFQVTEFLIGFGDTPPFIPLGSGEPGGDRQEFSEDSVDWKIGLNWETDERNFLYGVISRGHTTGSVNIFPPWDPYDEMVVLNYEGGWKAAWNDGQFMTQFAAYYENVEGYQTVFPDLSIPGAAGQVRNAESDSTIYGIEITGQANFGDFSWELGLSLNESELGDLTNITHPITGEILDLTGGSFPIAPDFTWNIGMEYRKVFSNGSTLVPRVDYGYIADTQAEIYDDPEFTLEARGLLNFQLRWQNENWYVVAWMTNATDERYAGAIQNQGLLYYAAPPRQYGLRAGWNF